MKAFEKLLKRFKKIPDIAQALERCRPRKPVPLLVGHRLLEGGCVRIPCAGSVVELCLGGEKGTRLHLHPERRLGKEAPGYWLVNMARLQNGHNGFFRLEPGAFLLLGRHSGEQCHLFDFSTRVARYHLMILHRETHLLCIDLTPTAATCLRLLVGLPPDATLAAWQARYRQHLVALFFRDTGLSDPAIHRPLPPAIALERLLRAHTLWRAQAFSPTAMPCCPAIDHASAQAAVPLLWHLPADTLPILVGDLHARVDNLLTLLTSGGVLAALESGRATLIFLGDAVHPDAEGHQQEMQSSLLMMDLIVTLMLHFPTQIIYLRGNHDSCTEAVYKGNVPQGELWQQALQKTRGKAYLSAMDAFYQDLPCLAVHPHLIAIHAAPPMERISPARLADLRNHPHLVQQMIWNRPHQPHRPGGYREKQINRLREALELSQDVPLVVGHTPLDREHTAWLHAGGVAHHHILYAGTPGKVGWLLCLPDRVVHLECPVEQQSVG
ncbi:MAG: metallophosphoesterase [Magnetococcales bacterium]|nr:metallophosphoesterase [Magnetococcales bacterium]